jgi:hypothetical protein
MKSLVTDYLTYNIKCFEVYDKNLHIFTFYNIDGDAIKSDEGISNDKLIDNMEKKCTLNDKKMKDSYFDELFVKQRYFKCIKTSTLDYNGDRYLSSIINCVIFRL